MIFLFIVVGCGNNTKKSENIKSEDNTKISVTKAEVNEKLKSLSNGLEVQYDDMKELTYFRCHINLDNHPHIFLIPYVVVDENYNFSLKNHILCVSTRNYEIIYFDTLYIKSSKGVENFKLDEKKIHRSYAGEEFIDNMSKPIYDKISESIEGNNIKFRLEGRVYSERNLTDEEISQIRAVFSIYKYLSSINVIN